METLYLIQLHQYPIFQQLQLEEALLRLDTRNFCLINQGSPDAIVMGISGKWDKLICPQHLSAKPIPVIRRFSGGGTVVVDAQTHFVSWIGHPILLGGAPAFPEQLLHWTADFYNQALPQLSLKVRENDYVVGDKKVGGNAQYIRKERWLHHTTFLWDYDAHKMKYLLLPERMPSYRQKRSHEAFLTPIKTMIPDQQQMTQGIVQELQKRFQVISVGLEELAPLLDQEHRKSTSLVKTNR